MVARRGASTRRLLVVVALGLALVVPLGPASAAVGPPRAASQALSPSALSDWCFAVTHVVPAGSGVIGAQSYQSCSGSVYRQEMDDYLDVCILDLVVCWEWTGNKLLKSMGKIGPGAWSIPIYGYFYVTGLKHGLRHRIRTLNWAWTYDSGLLHSTTTAEIFVP